jgi:N-acetylglucosaminyldiphosphoundecaprenol N-acetyl-beta-D-mannosaminyltransferase
LVARVLGTPIDVIDWSTALAKIDDWASRAESRYVCICNVHSVVTADQEASFGKVLRDSDLNTPDGAPLAWFLRRSGYRTQERINGPDLMLAHCERAAANGMPIFLYGGAETTLALMADRLLRDFPGLNIAGMHSPPFRELSSAENQQDIEMINASGARVVWVSLGCPKQEQWMFDRKGVVQAVMVGVGAAFDYHAGVISRAPLWMRDLGLEWVHRLAAEPRRLWRRYLFTNSYFIVKIVSQELKAALSRIVKAR